MSLAFLLLSGLSGWARLSSAPKEQVWKSEKSEHFEVRFKNAPSFFIKRVLSSAEEIYRRTTYTLGMTRYKGWSGGGRVLIEVYDSAEDYQRVSGLSWAGATVAVHQRRIMTFPSAQGFFDSTLPHELGHIIFHDFVGMDADVPLWLEEGIAVFQEASGRIQADEQVRKALAGGYFIPLSELGSIDLRGARKETVRLVYAESASVVGYLIDKQEIYRFNRLCKELKDGRRFEWALNKAYMKFKTVDDLELAWRNALSHGKNQK